MHFYCLKHYLFIFNFLNQPQKIVHLVICQCSGFQKAHRIILLKFFSLYKKEREKKEKIHKYMHKDKKSSNKTIKKH